MQMGLLWGLQNLVKRLPWGEYPGYRHQKQWVSDFGKKNILYVFDWHMRILAIIMLIYADLC